ncbi:MAG: cytochrome c biogenesis protein CcsA [Deltaproteobacteria bacterium]|nr:cytochrome c biogenesis protein CcsA [Deltaproteobacteria bacterium]
MFLICHIIGALAGELFAVLAAVLSFLYLVQVRLLKERRLDRLMFNLPALDVLERLLFISLGTGFFFLSLALLSGSIIFWQEGMQNSALVGKLIWALVVWSWYLIALLSRFSWKVSRKTTARMSLWGFCLLGGAYFGFIFR